MNLARNARLVFEAWREIARIDAVHRRRGFAGVRGLLTPPSGTGRDDEALTIAIRDAVSLAGSLYWKPVLCLQRSVALVRVMRRHGLRARLVIAYRPAPFAAHAWVEVDGRVVNDSQEYANRLQVLLTA